MQDKVLEILGSAKGWLTASDVADKGKFRSVANVGLCLKNLGDRVASRKSPTLKGSTNQPLVEWKHADKLFADEAPADPITRRSPVRDEVSDLRLEVEELKRSLDTAGGAAELNRMRIADLEDDVRRHTAIHHEASGAIIRFLIATQQITGGEHKPSNLVEAEQQIAATIRLMQGRVEELEESIHQMELGAEQSKPDQEITAGQFVVRTPSKPPRFTKKQSNAHAVAMSAARQHGFAEVFALVPVGKAVRGAEWKEAS